MVRGKAILIPVLFLEVELCDGHAGCEVMAKGAWAANFMYIRSETGFLDYMSPVMGGLEFRRRGSVLEAGGSSCWRNTRLTPHSKPLRPLYNGIRPLCWPPSSSSPSVPPEVAVTFLRAQHGGQRRARNAFSESVDAQSTCSEPEETLSVLVATKEHHTTSCSRALRPAVLV